MEKEKLAKAYIKLKKSSAYFQTWQWFYRGTSNLLKAGVYHSSIKEANKWIKENYQLV